MSAAREFPRDSRIGYVDLERVTALSSEGKAATAQPAANLWAVSSSETRLLWHLPTIDLSEEMVKQPDAAPAQ
jgi:hypothetical protein